MTNDAARPALLLDLGTMDYARAWQLQKRVWQLRVDGRIPDTLLLVEHPPVITLGKSGRMANLLVPEAELARQGIALYRIERGGDITWHGPGQLVGYPIFELRDALAGVRAFVLRLEQALIRALAAWSIAADTNPRHTGVWVGNDKIVALGIAVRRHVALHGFALNVSPDLAHFRLMNPCGLTDKGVTSMARLLDRTPSMSTVKHQVVSALEATFDLEFTLTCEGCLPEAAG